MNKKFILSLFVVIFIVLILGGPFVGLGLRNTIIGLILAFLALFCFLSNSRIAKIISYIIIFFLLISIIYVFVITIHFMLSPPWGPWSGG